MKFSKLIFVVPFLFAIMSCRAQRKASRIEIVQPTVEQEATSIWRTINDIVFFENQGYTVNLPKAPLIDSLLLKSKNGTFGNDDFLTIYSFVNTQVFDENNYKSARQKVESQIDFINNLIDEIDATKNQWDWDFKMFDKYRIFFTLYGTGGSYDPNEGTITLFTDKKGGFMNYKNPANTIIHEIAHMGIEHPIVEKYQLSHGLKERTVDTFVYLMFQEKLPEYKIQNMGSDRINVYLKTRSDLNSLNSIMERIMQN